MTLCTPVTCFQSIPPHIFPYGAAISFVIACSVTVPMAYGSGHVSGFVHISDTGTVSPESSVFGLMLSVYAVLVTLSVWNVYTTVAKPSALHGWACGVGFLSAIGVVIVANFQETLVLSVHILGALTAFGLATVYIWLTLVTSQHMRIFRMWCAALVTFSLVTSSVTGLVSMLKFKGKNRLHWTPADGGYELHVISVFAEWFMAVGINMFIATLAMDIKVVKKRMCRRRDNNSQVAQAPEPGVVETNVLQAAGEQQATISSVTDADAAVRRQKSSESQSSSVAGPRSEGTLSDAKKNVPTVAH